MKTFICLPPLPKVSGGLAVLLNIGRFLHQAGFPAAFVLRETPAWADSIPGEVNQLWWENVQLGGANQPKPEDIWLAPEGWPNVLLPGLQSRCRVVVYVQNWAYLLSEWPPGLEPDKLPVSYLAVSRPVAWYVEHVTGKKPEILRPGIDLGLFSPGDGQNSQLTVGGRSCRVAWMPRKNRALARQIREMVDARRAALRQSPLEWVEIHKVVQDEVAKILRGCDIFLCTGFPEGCALPPLEAMACGCVGVGFSGFGCWDYMRLTGCDENGLLPGWLPPEITADAEIRPGNGFWCADGDVVMAGMALEKAVELFMEGGQAWRGLQANALATARLYGREIQRENLLKIWNKARSGELFEER